MLKIGFRIYPSDLAHIFGEGLCDMLDLISKFINPILSLKTLGFGPDWVHDDIEQNLVSNANRGTVVGILVSRYL